MTRQDLEQLSAPEHPGTHVSMFLPTHRYGSGVQADQLRWKEALSALEPELLSFGMRRPDVEELLAPGWALHRDALAWQYMSDGLAMFLRPGWHQTFRIPVDVSNVTTVGDRFVIGPLLPLLSGDQRFLLLTVSQSRIRLLEGTRHSVEEVVLPEVPSSWREVIEPPERRSDTMARAISPGRGGPAVFYGHGAADDHVKSDEVERFLRQVASGLDSYLAAHDLPLVLMGLDQLVSVYRGVTGYARVLDDAVHVNPDPLSADELHAAAWPVVARRLAADKREVVGRFEQLHGTGRASVDPAMLAGAAAEGRIDTLLVAAKPTCWEQSNSGAPNIIRLDAGEFAACKQLDQITTGTLTRSGAVFTFSDTPVPGGGDVAALLRY